MPTLELNCSGKAKNKHPAELATVTVNISARELNIEVAIKNVTETARTITYKLETHKSAGVQKFHLQRFATRSQNEYSANSNKLLRLWHHCSTTITIQYNDFEVMSTTVPEIAAMNKFIEVGRIEWSLLPETVALLKERTRAEATRDAIEAARSMFNAANVQTFHLVALTNGKLPYMHSQERLPLFAYACEEGVTKTAKPTISFEPEDIQIEVEVTTRFQADAPRC